jgi:hypothetical protein
VIDRVNVSAVPLSMTLSPRKSITKMPSVSGLSDVSPPSSAHALQLQKEDQAHKQGIIFLLGLGVIAVTGTIIGFLMENIVRGFRGRAKDRKSDSPSDEEITDELLEDDMLAIEAAQFGNKVKRGVGEDKVMREFMGLLKDPDFLEFLYRQGY